MNPTRNRTLIGFTTSSTQSISKIKSSLSSQYYTEVCNERRVHLRDLAPGQRSSEEKRHSVGDSVSDLVGTRIKPVTPHTNSDVINHYDLWLVRSFQVMLLNVFCIQGTDLVMMMWSSVVT